MRNEEHWRDVAPPPALRFGNDEIVVPPPEPEIVWLLLVFALAAGVFFAFGGYALIAANQIFADVVVEVLLGAGLLKGVRTVERPGWILGVWRNTWPSLAFSLAVAVAFGLYAKLEVPGANTLFEVFMKGN